MWTCTRRSTGSSLRLPGEARGLRWEQEPCRHGVSPGMQPLAGPFLCARMPSPTLQECSQQHFHSRVAWPSSLKSQEWQ